MLKNRVICGGILILLTAAFIATNNRLVLILLVCFAALCFLTLLLLLFERAGISVEVELPYSSACTNPYLNIKMKRRWKLPTGNLRFRIEYENALYQEAQSLVLLLETADKYTTEYKMEFAKQECGEYHIQFRQGRAEDLLGIWQLPITAPGDISYLVYPLIPDIALTMKAERIRKSEGEQYSQNQSGHDVSEVFDLRDYHKGDGLNSIHWKLSSKLDKLIVREYGKPANQNIAIFYDGAFFGYDKAHQLVNGILGITAAMSQALLRDKRIHCICRAYAQKLVYSTICSTSDMMDCLTLLLESHLSAMDVSSLSYEFRQIGEHLIYITGCLNEMQLNQLAEYTDLTVILVTDGTKEYMEDHANYKIIAISLNRLEGKIQRIML